MLQLPTNGGGGESGMGQEDDSVSRTRVLPLRGPIIREQGPSVPNSPVISPRLRRPPAPLAQ